MGMNQGELKRSIKEDPNLTEQEKGAKLSELRAPYKKMSDEELLSLVRDFVRENGREPMQKDVLYDRELKAHFSEVLFSSLSNFLAASSNVLKVAQGGAAVSLSSDKN